MMTTSSRTATTARKLKVGDAVEWTVRGNTITGLVRQVKGGGWYRVQAQHEIGSPLFLGFEYVVQSRHLSPICGLRMTRAEGEVSKPPAVDKFCSTAMTSGEVTKSETVS